MGLPVEVNPLFLENQYAIQRSLRFRASASASLTRTPSVASNQQKWTWSGWIKRGQLSGSSIFNIFGARTASSGTYTLFIFNNDSLYLLDNNGATVGSTAVYRDVSSFYHIICSVDTTQATAANRVIFYVNGVQVTSYAAATYPSLNLSMNVNSTATQLIGQNASSQYFDGYMAEVNFIDGLSFFSDTSGTANTSFNINSFGQYNEFGVWSPRKYGGSYGTNGFYLPFNDPTSATTLCYDRQLGYTDTSKNNWTPNNISVTAGPTYDAMTDVPPPSTIQNVRAGNYATLNPLDNPSAYFVNATFSAANLNISATSTGQYYVHPTISNNTGKFYHEFTATSLGAGGALTNSIAISAPGNPGAVYCAYDKSGQKYVSGAWTTGWTAWSANDVIGIAVDYDAGSATYYLNGTLQGTLTFGSQGSAPLCVANNAQAGSGGTVSVSFNAGQRPFSYTPPSGFLPLNSNNLPTPTIPNGAKVMAATTYTGNGTGSGSTQNINNGANTTLGTTFQPDLVWIKSRTTADYHNLVDSVRGISTSSPNLFSNTTSGDTVFANAGVTAVSGTGFTLLANGSYTNANGTNYISWQWNAGSGSSTIPSGGSITPTGASINKSAGFSIISYTGTGANATLPHGLGAAPQFVIIKSRSPADWYVGHSSIGWSNTGYLILNNTGAAGQYGSVAVWQATAPDSSVIYLGTASGVNAATALICYAWTPIAGYSSFGSYVGTNSTDNVFVYLGFRPRYLLIKCSSSAGSDWVIYDSSRTTYNPTTDVLWADLSVAENNSSYSPKNGAAGNGNIDFLSNGFKVRSSASAMGGADTYIYAAFAENPFKLALAR